LVLILGTASEKNNEVVRFLQLPSLCDEIALEVLLGGALTKKTERKQMV